MNIVKKCILDNVSNEQEPPHGSQSKSNIPNRQNMGSVEVPKII
jgi:hypothetical protein